MKILWSQASKHPVLFFLLSVSLSSVSIQPDQQRDRAARCSSRFQRSPDDICHDHQTACRVVIAPSLIITIRRFFFFLFIIIVMAVVKHVPRMDHRRIGRGPNPRGPRSHPLTIILSAGLSLKRPEKNFLSANV